MESRTFISTENKNETIPTPREGVKGTLGNWISPNDMDSAILERFPGCMTGKNDFATLRKSYRNKTDLNFLIDLNNDKKIIISD